MPEANASQTIQRFGQTARRDALVDDPGGGLHHPQRFCGVHHLGRVSRRVLCSWALFLVVFGGLLGDSPHSWFGPKPGWWPAFLPFSPALLILWAPGLFRLTCYYYRGAYYKAFFADPVSCTVSESKKRYTGEKSFPLGCCAKHTPLFRVHRLVLFADLGLRCLEGDVVFRSRHGQPHVWHRRGHPDLGDQRGFARRLHPRVPLPCATWWGASWTGCRAPPCGAKPTCASPASTKNTCSGRGCSLFSVAFSDIYIRMCAMGISTAGKSCL